MTETRAASPAPRLLILDDEEAIAHPMARFFRQLGCQADVACEAEEAAALVDHRRYDLAILDLRLNSYGGAEGLDVLREIRRTNPGTAVIVLSAFVSDEMEVEARRCGADRILAKPQDLPQLAAVAASLIGVQLG
ncbi:MAG TPA: response regulator [Vicinamibacteria bacterium]|nr:response regulator [Vicinamibacteria bacterium]